MHSSGKNLLLINPWIYDFTAYDLWSQPLGLLYIASFLQSHGFNISYIDCLNSENGSVDKRRKKYGIGNYQRQVIESPQILKDIPRKFARYGISENNFRDQLKRVPPPDAVLVTSIMTYWYLGPQNVIAMVKQAFPDVPVILGGIYASLLPRHAQEVVGADFIIEGPGEWQALQLLSKLLGIDVDPLITTRTLDDYPYPAFDLISNPGYLCVMTARGCPYNCSFCAQKKIAMKFSQRDPEAVLKEFDYHYKKYKLRDFAFYDDALFINKEKHIKKILKGIINSRLSINLHTPNGLFARDIDEELAMLMYQANFKTIRLSFETANEKRRKDMNNKISNTGMQSAVKNLIKAGYAARDLDAYVIMGLPGQSLDEILESIVFVNNLGVQVSMASYSPISGTLDFQRAVDSGLIKEDIDPLLTNKTLFPLKNDDLDYETFRKTRIFSQILNDAARKDFTPFARNNIGKSLRRVLKKIS